eukprot:TRINITY_DN4029_c0_g2_i2.p1 TRINITY_DN4029_c0_g2~~TRINITY_DN4029_c0_g2_i2.p1  ORF type:complete len:692 (-),score=110.32 TRINITY_DN4029_c0_g2_i2:2238-4313(-)
MLIRRCHRRTMRTRTSSCIQRWKSKFTNEDTSLLLEKLSGARSKQIIITDFQRIKPGFSKYSINKKIDEISNKVQLRSGEKVYRPKNDIKKLFQNQKNVEYKVPKNAESSDTKSNDNIKSSNKEEPYDDIEPNNDIKPSPMIRQLIQYNFSLFRISDIPKRVVVRKQYKDLTDEHMEDLCASGHDKDFIYKYIKELENIGYAPSISQTKSLILKYSSLGKKNRIKVLIDTLTEKAVLPADNLLLFYDENDFLDHISPANEKNIWFNYFSSSYKDMETFHLILRMFMKSKRMALAVWATMESMDFFTPDIESYYLLLRIFQNSEASCNIIWNNMKKYGHTPSLSTYHRYLISKKNIDDVWKELDDNNLITTTTCNIALRKVKRNTKKVNEILEYMEQKGLKQNINTKNILLQHYIKNTEKFKQTWEEMEKDELSYNIYLEKYLYQDELFKIAWNNFPNNMKHNMRSYHLLLKHIMKTADNPEEQARKVWKNMEINKLPITIHTYKLLLRIFRDTDTIQSIWNAMRDLGHVHTSIQQELFNIGNYESERKLLELKASELPSGQVKHYSRIIKNTKRLDMIMETHNRAKTVELKLDDVYYLNLLSSAKKLARDDMDTFDGLFEDYLKSNIFYTKKINSKLVYLFRDDPIKLKRILEKIGDDGGCIDNKVYGRTEHMFGDDEEFSSLLKKTKSKE